MLVSDFITDDAPPLPVSLQNTDRLDKYLIRLVSHAYEVSKEIDELENDGETRQQRLYDFEIERYPNIRFSIRIPTRHRYRLENRGLSEGVSNAGVISNSSPISNQSLISN